MIWQRLQGNGSMAAAVQYLVQSDSPGLQSGCRRWTADKVSAGTGGYLPGSAEITDDYSQ